MSTSPAPTGAPAGPRGTRRGQGRLVALVVAAMCCQGCAPVYWVGARLLYNSAPNPPSVTLNVPYDPAAPDDPKRQLDLYLPGGRDFPTVVFVHGGGWAWGACWSSRLNRQRVLAGQINWFCSPVSKIVAAMLSIMRWVSPCILSLCTNSLIRELAKQN